MRHITLLIPQTGFEIVHRVNWLRRIIAWTAQFYTEQPESEEHLSVNGETVKDADDTFNTMFDILALGEMSVTGASQVSDWSNSPFDQVLTIRSAEKYHVHTTTPRP